MSVASDEPVKSPYVGLLASQITDHAHLQHLLYVQDVDLEMEVAHDDAIRTLGLTEGAACVMKVGRRGVMADSGANSCMVASERYLVGCHDIEPVTLGLALKIDNTHRNFQCSRVGYLPMTRDDGHVHHQPCLVNDNATDSIMSPEAIMHSCSDFVHWRQEGFIGSAQGTLQFFGINDALLLTLRLVKRN